MLYVTEQKDMIMAEQTPKEFLAAIRADIQRQHAAEGQAFVDRVLGDIFRDDIAVTPTSDQYH